MRLLILAGALFCASAYASQKTPQFEVASIKTNTSVDNLRGGCHGVDSAMGSNRNNGVPLGRCVITAGRLSHIINIAFRNGPMNTIRGGPDWVITDRYDVVAKAENPETATEEQLLGMLRNLLLDRFKLRFHRETKEINGYALVVGKRGPKLKEASGESESKLEGVATKVGGKLIPAGRDGKAVITAQRISMSTLASSLSALGIGQIIDRTGLSRTYDFELEFEDLGALSSAVEDQLGLRLEAIKLPTDFFLIDSAEKPKTN